MNAEVNRSWPASPPVEAESIRDLRHTALMAFAMRHTSAWHRRSARRLLRASRRQHNEN